MLKEHTKYRFPDLGKENDLVFEVNYADNDIVKDCRVIKWTVGEDQGFIERKHLFEFLWTIGKPEEQRRMIPQKIRKVRNIQKLLKVKATKDVRKGEELIFQANIEVPLSEEELISEIKKSKKGFKFWKPF